MSIWKTLKEMVFGSPLKKQFEQMIQDEAMEKAKTLILTELAPEAPAKAMPAAVNDQITDAVTQAAPAKPKRARKPKAEAAPAAPKAAPKAKKPAAKKKK